MLAAIVPYYTYPDLFRGRKVHHWIDNTVALSALVHGYARRPDMAKMINAFHLQAAGLGVGAYFEYVPSKANIADLPSRGSYELLERLGGALEEMEVPAVDTWAGPLGAWFDRVHVRD